MDTAPHASPAPPVPAAHPPAGSGTAPGHGSAQTPPSRSQSSSTAHPPAGSRPATPRGAPPAPGRSSRQLVPPQDRAAGSTRPRSPSRSGQPRPRPARTRPRGHGGAGSAARRRDTAPPVAPPCVIPVRELRAAPLPTTNFPVRGARDSLTSQPQRRAASCCTRAPVAPLLSAFRPALLRPAPPVELPRPSP